MAWPIQRRLADGTEAFYVGWTHPTKTDARGRPLRACDPAVDALGRRATTMEEARAIAEDWSWSREKRVPRAQRTAASSALDRMLDALVARGGSLHTRRQYADRLREFIAHQGGKPMSVWTRADFMAFAASRSDRWGPNTVHKFRGLCRMFVRFCESEEPPVACADFVPSFKKLPKRRPVERAAWTADEARRILAEAHGTRLEVAVHLGLYAAMGVGCVQSLTWADIDASAEPWLIRGVRAKTKVPRRVEVVPALRAALERNRATHGLVCRSLPARVGDIDRALASIVARAKARSGGGFHRLRHTCLSLLALGGADLATLRRVGCFQPTSTVVLRYLHDDSRRVSAALSTLSAAIAAG